jgi:ribosomal-protein-alanine N-acetyltransferase
MKLGRARSTVRETNPSLRGRRLHLRPLVPSDFDEWREVRTRNADWLTKWEPSRPPGSPDVINDRHAFAARCNARERERHLGTGFGFGVFVDGAFAGEMNLSSVQRGPFQNCYVGYWIDEAHAGKGYTPEALVAVLRFGFEELGLHRLQIAIIPRNTASRRVVEKLDIREEGVAVRYLEINGAWEDHVRYAMTSEDWDDRRDELIAAWLDG